MNLLCPSCQNPLSVPEQYAGQLMKCPLCNNNFTVPPLPASSGEPVLTLPPHEPEPHDSTPIDLTGHPSPSAPPPLLSAHEGEPAGLYGLTPEPTRPAPVQQVPRPAPPPAPPPPPAPASVKTAPPPPPRPRTGDYGHVMAFAVNPRIVPWIAPACLVLVFLLSFFPWVGRYYGGYNFLSQSAWGAAFGGYTINDVYDHKVEWEKTTKPEDKPGAGVLMVMFLFLGLLPAVLVGVFVALLPRLQSQFKMPPGLNAVLPWRWLIVTGITFVPLLFLFLQILTPFSLETRTRDMVERKFAKERVGISSIDAQWVDMQEAQELAEHGLQRTTYMRLSFLLLVVAAVGAAMAHWMEHRGHDRPPPRLEILW